MHWYLLFNYIQTYTTQKFPIQIPIVQGWMSRWMVPMLEWVRCWNGTEWCCWYILKDLWLQIIYHVASTFDFWSFFNNFCLFSTTSAFIGHPLIWQENIWIQGHPFTVQSKWITERVIADKFCKLDWFHGDPLEYQLIYWKNWQQWSVFKWNVKKKWHKQFNSSQRFYNFAHTPLQYIT